MATVVEMKLVPDSNAAELKFQPDSHLGSSFIESLRKKYPKACNRSLTNLSVVGLSLPECKHERPSRSSGAARGDCLSPFSKGLSSSQPDLLKASGLAFQSHSIATDVEVPMVARAASTSGLNLLLSYNAKPRLTASRTNLTSSVVEERLRASRAKMDELANRITEISRSNSDLVNIGKDSTLLTAAPRLPTDSEDIDDSAPIPSQYTKSVATSQSSTARASHSNFSSLQTAPKLRLSSTEAKTKLEELRMKLTKKCEHLQQRRDDLFNRINSRLPDKQASEQSPAAIPDGVGTVSKPCAVSPPSSNLSSANIATPRKSGTDSDGDSGIDLSMKRNKLPPTNSLVPKLRKFKTNSEVLTHNKPSLHLPTQVTKESKELNHSTMQSNSTTGGTLPTSTIQASSDECTSVTSGTLDRHSPTLNDSAVEHLSSKSVRFSQTPQVIISETPRLLELQQLAEESASALDVLPDTDLTQLDSESDTSSSDSEYSSTDLTDIDPRLAQLALGTRHVHNSKQLSDAHAVNPKPLPSTKTITDDAIPSSSPQSPSKPSIATESHKPNNISVNNPSFVKDASSELPSKQKVSVTSIPPSSKSGSPPKPLRTNASNITASTVTRVGQPKQTADNILPAVAQPYSIIDISSFQRPPTDEKTKKKKNDKKQKNLKPPIPKSAPVKAAPVKATPVKAAPVKSAPVKAAPVKAAPISSSNVAADDSYEEVDFSRNSSQDGSSRSKLEKRDLDGPEVADDDTLSQSTTLSRRSAHSNSTVSNQFSQSPAAGARSGSCGDLWGSNASLYSSNEKLGSNNSLSGSRSSLFERVGSFKHAASKKIKSLKRSLSLDRLGPSKSGNSELPPTTPLSKKSPKASAGSSGDAIPSIKKPLSWRAVHQLKFTKKSKQKVDTSTSKDSSRSKESEPKKSMAISSSAPGSVDEPSHFRRIGKLLELCVDGCRRIQLNRPPHGPFGFYIGQSDHRPGVFVTRLSDSYAEKLFAGLLSVGDEIKEINNSPANKLSQSEILDIISKSEKLVLKVRANNAITAEEWF